MALHFLMISRGLSTSNVAAGAIKNVTVVGGGLMGSGVAQVAAQTGHNVTLIDVNDAALKKASDGINTNVQRIAKKLYKDQPAEGDKFIKDTISKLNFSLDLPTAAKNSDLVVEAIVEKIAAKHELFSKIDSISPEHTVFASNTSSLSITEIASVTKRKDKFVGLHFFNPVPVMKLLEVIRTEDTSDDTYQKVMEWGKSIGKVTITCKDTPGFVVNRLLVPLLCEAIRMMERGDASPRDIDIAMKLGAGHPMGPIELADYVGHDTTKSIVEVCKIICVASIAPIGIEPIEKYGRSQDYTLVTLRDRRGCTSNTDDVPSNRVNTTSRLKELRDLMRSKNISAYIIPNSDDHQTEIVGPVDQRRHYISGFSGTNGDAVVTLTSAALWTDSRYDLQADEQLDCNWLLMKTALQSIPNIPVWLSTQLLPGSVVSVDGKKINFSQWQKWYNYLSTYQLTLYAANENLVDTVWKNRPSYPNDPLIIHDIKYAGETWQNKLSRLRNIFSQLRVDFQIVTALDEIAWLLNLRGNDIPFSPLFRSYLIVGKTWATLYLPQGKINQQIRSHLYTKNDYVFVKSYDWIWYDLMTLAKTMYYYTILVPSSINSSKGASYLIHSLVPSEKVLSIPSPIVNMKANKNSVEVSGIKKAHIRDAVALCQLWYEMEKDLAAGIAWDELKVVRKLIELRAEQPLNRGASFSSIVAFGTNGALPHYIPTPDTNKRIDTSGMLTIDSGGQYLDGTIDTTRVLHFGTPTREQQNIYTSLLKGCIDLVTSEFKPGTTMQELEPILRRPLLEMGLNYGHGSTHGTGMFLTVHESFNYTYDINFIGSQEPGYYKENEFGMRLENLVQVKEVPVPMNSSQNQLFTFEAVTLVPYENKLINSCSLDKKKKKWLFTYYVIIRSLVGGEMVKQGRHDLYRWLIDKTDPTFKCYEPLPKVVE